jgi:predicted MFS family arabinose efflux permease
MALFGSGCMAVGFAAMLAYALVSSSLSVSPPILGIWLIFILINAGMGWRGPPGFLAALQAANGSDNRASALLVIFFVSLVASGTAIVGIVIESGLVPLTTVAFLMALAAVCLLLTPNLRVGGD